jgi:hypothetical protein
VTKIIATSLLILALVSIPAVAQKPPQAKNAVTVADLLTPAKNQPMIGRYVTLWYQPVQVKTGSDAVWIGPNQDQMVLLAMPPTVHVLDQDGEPVKLEEGDYIQVKALVTRAPNDYELRRGWGVDGDDLYLAQRSGVILIARDVKLMAEDGD